MIEKIIMGGLYLPLRTGQGLNNSNLTGISIEMMTFYMTFGISIEMMTFYMTFET